MPKRIKIVTLFKLRFISNKTTYGINLEISLNPLLNKNNRDVNICANRAEKRVNASHPVLHYINSIFVLFEYISKNVSAVPSF